MTVGDDKHRKQCTTFLPEGAAVSSGEMIPVSKQEGQISVRYLDKKT